MAGSEPRSLGLGIAWRPELAQLAADDERLFVEVIAENVDPARLPGELTALVGAGRNLIPHGIRLSLGGADHPDPGRLAHLAALAHSVNAPLVSEHIAFARAHGIEAGHVLPVARTHEALEIIAENVAIAQAALPVPLALEHVAALVEWPQPDMTEPEFISELVARTGAMLLLDVSNLFANAHNHGFDAASALDELPLDRVAYVHVGGGVLRDGRYHDTHCDPVVPGVLELLEELCARTAPPGILLERDGNFAPSAELRAELAQIEAAAARGTARRAASV
ncbi:MAG TPA: DUF692 domain-containing protein [Solirubrobacteraceae bacterium]